ncbi:hypothetical protein Sgleb_65180 [Streptomyces glebosus]|uniref:Uncharacterized protein n=1 Tax=Streptomyces glebosus TaxID=249580 RepID=A0A640T7G9_9ACTN|nr:hypothetical protein Sgleb_65180 [Streptomyces glebosus]GHG58921.1 hypothetical protein GCM10010513_23410 [Streptomyces glebosus]
MERPRSAPRLPAPPHHPHMADLSPALLTALRPWLAGRHRIGSVSWAWAGPAWRRKKGRWPAGNAGGPPPESLIARPPLPKGRCGIVTGAEIKLLRTSVERFRRGGHADRL